VSPNVNTDLEASDNVKKVLKTQFNKLAESGDILAKKNSPAKSKQFLHSSLNIKREAHSTGTQSASKGSHYALLPPM
jgi:hypothetical protein